MNEFVIPRPAGYASDAAANTGTTLFALGMWIRLGFIGACLVAGSVASLSDGDVAMGTVFSLGATGALLAVVSWQRVRKALRAERFDEAMAQRAPR